MSNVRKGMTEGGIPEILQDDKMLPVKLPPETIQHERTRSAGKAGMNFTHPQLGPEQHYVDSEEGGAKLPAAEGSAGAEHGEPGHPASGKLEGGKKKPRHRSVSGVPGRTLVGS